MKRCRRCGETKAAGEFYHHLYALDGLHSYCKTCCGEIARAYRRANHAAVLRRQRAYREANYEFVAERKRVYAAANGEACAARTRAHYAANREAIAVAKRERNAVTRASATHHGLRWTAAEDALVLRDDLTLNEIAFMLQRTRDAVMRQRWLLRNRAAVSA